MTTHDLAFTFAPPERPRVAVAGTNEWFPVHRIYCVGRNYADHAREMGANPEREPPFFFAKPADAVVASGATVAYPLATRNFHHEIELVVAVGREAVNLDRQAALDCVYGYAVGVDLTRRDLQLAARDGGRPWDAGKGFDQSAPVTPIRRATEVGHPVSGAIWLKVNEAVRQSADIAQLIWPVPDVLVHLSRLFVLKPGDLIYTGTPAGVGPLERGDRVTGGIAGIGEIALTIGQ
ncbi:MAG TPA: fumarylacetoacetate hydrolase family protein [Polyangiaceae bacterium]|nr:fumarylacetoacetate hydrolase family protein [Polyangiaceae bacterium]